MSVNMTAQTIAVGDNWTKVGNDYVGDNPSGGFTGDWQLSATNYVDRVIDPELIFPRPDTETPVWAKHRRHHPNVPYRIPIGISFGSWPFYFEAISVPSGATVGSFLTASGDKLIVGDDYGVVEWTNPTVGNHSFHIRVHFQDGYPPLNVQWTLEVTTVGTIFIDPVGGSDTTGDGTIGNPFQTIESWWLGSQTDAAYREYQVCYRAGTHNVAADNTTTGITGGNWQLNGTDKPLVHYGYQGEAVIFNMSDTTIVVGQAAAVSGVSGSDTWFSNIEFNGGPTARDNPKQFFYSDNTSSAATYSAGGNGQRCTWFECTHKDFVNVTTAANNSGVLWAPNPIGNKRHYWAVIRPVFDNVRYSTGVHLNFNGFYLSGSWHYLGEHVTCTNTNFGKGPVTCKSSGNFVCSRNHDYTAAPNQIFGMNVAGSYDAVNAETWELSYSKINTQLTDTVDVCVYVNQSVVTYDPVGQNHKPVHIYRNTMSRAPDNGGNMRIAGGWDVVMKRNVVVAEAAFYGGGTNSNSGDADDYLLYAVASNPLDLSLDLTSTARTTYLGSYGAEVAS